MQQPALYIAGPEVLYRGGEAELAIMRQVAESRGFTVTLPNDKPLELGNADRRKDADAIFANCAVSMNASTAIICDLDSYRGTEPDGGSVYELGMAYARDLPLYGFTRDLRPIAVKAPGVLLRDGQAWDVEGRRFPYAHLPFCPSIIGSTKIIEGTFTDAVDLFTLDQVEERKATALGFTQRRRPDRGDTPRGRRPLAYLAGPDRFDQRSDALYADLKTLCDKLGLDAVTPLDPARGVPDLQSDPDPVVRASNLFDNYQQHVRDCDVLVADLSDYHGLEPNSDTSFECGMAFQLGKRLFGYMADDRLMIDRIPNLGPEHDYADLAGAKAENFNYPINLMFASSMPIVSNSFADAVALAARSLGTAN